MRFGPAFKHDLVTGRTEAHDFGPDRVALDSAEDDGYVMTYVYDANRDRSDVVIWSATEFGAEPLAVIELPVRVPFGFHGDWIAELDLPGRQGGQATDHTARKDQRLHRADPPHRRYVPGVHLAIATG